MNILKSVTFHLCDTNEALVSCWRNDFRDQPNYNFYVGDIFTLLPQLNESAIVSPANSFGDMQGGIDLVYHQFFGYGLEGKLQKTIKDHKFGELIVGDAVIIDIPTSKKGIRYLISAPTMRVPMDIRNTANVYLAFRAILISVIQFNTSNNKNPIKHVICPGLGTGVGQISPETCSKQMAYAYHSLTNSDHKMNLNERCFEHHKMIK